MTPAWAVMPIAGRGTRLHPAAAVIPKALLPVGAWPMLHGALDECVRAGIGGIVLVMGPEQTLVHVYLDEALADRITDELLGQILGDFERDQNVRLEVEDQYDEAEYEEKWPFNLEAKAAEVERQRKEQMKAQQEAEKKSQEEEHRRQE